MSWLQRIRHAPPKDLEAVRKVEPAPASVERAAPGIAALFSGLEEDGNHAVLDLGPAAEAHLRIYGAFAHQIRFAEMVPRTPRGAAWTSALDALPPNPHHPYDLVLGWNILDRLGPDERPLLVEKLDALTAPGARLYIVVDASGENLIQTLHFKLLTTDRVAQRAVGPPEPSQGQLLPAQVERLLTPFEVMHAFTLRLGLREYVAVKGSDLAPRPPTR